MSVTGAPCAKARGVQERKAGCQSYTASFLWTRRSDFPIWPVPCAPHQTLTRETIAALHLARAVKQINREPALSLPSQDQLMVWNNLP